MGEPGEYSVARIRELQEGLKARIRTASTVEAAAQTFTDILAEELDLALARVYATLELQSLPPFNREFVVNRAQEAKVESLLKPDTLVLSLLGTRGARPEWNHPSRSKRYLGVPLVSDTFLSSMPMFSALLSELGVGPEWLTRRAQGVPIDQLLGGEPSGIFHVASPRTALDSRGRRIIPAQDFIAEQRVATVFGIGGTWPNGHLTACIVFTRDPVDRNTVRRLAPMLGVFRAATTTLAMAGKYFA
jgi:hypothetical protein